MGSINGAQHTHTVLTHDENSSIFYKTRVSKEYSAVFFVQNFILSCNSIKFSNKTFFIMIFICIQPKSVSNRNDHAFNEWTRSGTHDWLIEFFGRFRIKRFTVNFQAIQISHERLFLDCVLKNFAANSNFLGIKSQANRWLNE